MDQGRSRPPLRRYRSIILMTIAGLVLVTLIPIARSAPGLSQVPRRGPSPVTLALVPVDSFDRDSEQGESSPDGSDRSEEGPIDSESPVEESLSVEWLGVRYLKGREADHSRWIQGPSPVESWPGIPAGRSLLRGFAVTGSFKPGLPIQLGRLLF